MTTRLSPQPKAPLVTPSLLVRVIELEEAHVDAVMQQYEGRESELLAMLRQAEAKEPSETAATDTAGLSAAMCSSNDDECAHPRGRVE